MQTEPYPTKNQSSEHPPSSFWTNKKIIIWIILIVLLLALILLLYQRNNPEKKIPVISTIIAKIENLKRPNISAPTPAQISPNIVLLPTKIPRNNPSFEYVTRLSDNVISQNVYDWLSKQKDQEGVYLDRIAVCEKDNKNCDPPKRNFKDGQAAIWGEFQYYQATKKEGVLASLLQDISIHSKPEILGGMQMYFWNCKLMYDLWISDVFKPDQKDQIQNICMAAGYYPPEEDQITAFITKNPSYDPDIEVFMTAKKLPDTITTNADYIDEYASYASDYAIRAKWFNQPELLTKAKLYIIKALDVYFKDTAKAKEYRSMIAMSLYDLYTSTQDEKFLSISDILLADTFTYDCTGIMDCYNRIMLAKKISSLEKYKDKYFESGDKYLLSLINLGYDAQGYFGFRNDFRAFHGLTAGDYIYRIRENGLVLGLLSDYLYKP